MRNLKKYSVIIGSFIISLLLFSSCKDFLNPDQELNITEDKLFDDWYEYRSVAMGMYAAQADLVEQLVVLGELRGDLLKITNNADADLVEIYNFNVTEGNKYASPIKFFKLISACNNLMTILEKNHPEVLDPGAMITNYDRLYGEVLCMRAWAYFNAVRIYGKVPYIPSSLTTIEEVNAFVESPDNYNYLDSMYITYGRNGYFNDTTYNKVDTLTKQYYDQDIVIDLFTNELEDKVKAVGVNHYIDNNDITWEVTVWNEYAKNTLLGQMYLTDGALDKAVKYFEKITNNFTEENRYQLTNAFANNNWRSIFSAIDVREHIYTLWFNKSFYQQNELQRLFDPREPHPYMLKPTRQAVLNWETIWDNYRLNVSTDRPSETRTAVKGTPGDFFRGYGVSYAYIRNGEPVPEDDIEEMLFYKSSLDFRSASLLVENADTAVWKYSWNKEVFDQDANFIVYRAAGVHLWLAEAYVWWAAIRNGILREFTSNAVSILNDGSQYGLGANRPQLGVRGRVGFGGTNDGVRIYNINYVRQPFTNEVIGWLDYTGEFLKKQKLLEEFIMEERARELAFEGERFYDLIRVAKRRKIENPNSDYLARKVSQKFPPERREEIYNKLLDENNWYINYFK